MIMDDTGTSMIEFDALYEECWRTCHSHGPRSRRSNLRSSLSRIPASGARRRLFIAVLPSQCPNVVHRQPLDFDNEADATPHGAVGISNSSRATAAILPLFFLCEPSRLSRRPSACNAACEEAPSGQRHGHSVLPYWKGADEDGSSVIHGGHHSCLPAPSKRLTRRRYRTGRVCRPFWASTAEPLYCPNHTVTSDGDYSKSNGRHP